MVYSNRLTYRLAWQWNHHCCILWDNVYQNVSSFSISCVISPLYSPLIAAIWSDSKRLSTVVCCIVSFDRFANVKFISYVTLNSWKVTGCFSYFSRPKYIKYPPSHQQVSTGTIAACVDCTRLLLACQNRGGLSSNQLNRRGNKVLRSR